MGPGVLKPRLHSHMTSHIYISTSMHVCVYVCIYVWLSSCTMLIPHSWSPHQKQRAASQSLAHFNRGFKPVEGGSVKRFPSRLDTTDPGSRFLLPLRSASEFSFSFFFASRHGTFDVGERRDPMIRTYVIIGVLGRVGPGKWWWLSWGRRVLDGCCRMFESTVQLSSETDASFYNAEAFEMHI